MPPAAAPPSKPATPAPAAPSIPAPQPPAPTPDAPVKSSADAFDDKFSDLDTAPPPPAPKPAATAPPAKPDPAKPDVKPEPKAAAVDKEPVDVLDHDDNDFEPPSVAKPSELRAFATRKGIQAAKATTALKQLRDKLQQMELEVPKNGHADTSLLSEQLAAANKRIEGYESELKTTRYERSQEYKDKWEVPYTKATSRAYRDIGELTVTVANPNDPDQPTERQATKADFDAVFQQPLGAATKLAKQLFGDSYTLVLQHRERIKELQEGAWQAVEEYRTKGSEKEQQDQARTKQEQAFMESAWQKANESMKQKGAEFFDERPDDAEGNDLLKKGMDHADLAFDSKALEAYPPVQQIAVHARIRNWAGSFLRNRRDITQLKAQLAEANATIEQLRGSGPGKPAAASDAVPSSEGKTLSELFDERVK